MTQAMILEMPAPRPRWSDRPFSPRQPLSASAQHGLAVLVSAGGDMRVEVFDRLMRAEGWAQSGATGARNRLARQGWLSYVDDTLVLRPSARRYVRHREKLGRMHADLAHRRLAIDAQLAFLEEALRTGRHGDES